MMYFIHNVKTYSSLNRKGQEMCEFAKVYERMLIQDKRSLKSLMCEFIDMVDKLNEKYPHSKVLKFREFRTSNGGQWIIKLGDDENSPVSYISFSAVRGTYSFGNCSCTKEQEGGV